MNKTAKIIIGCVLAGGAVFCIVKVAMMLYQPKPTVTATMSATTTTEETEYTAPDESAAVIPTYTSVTTAETTESNK